MKIKSGMETEYEKYKAINKEDAYSARVVSYGEDWANLMEKDIGEQTNSNAIEHTIRSVAESTSREADTDGLTGFMYGAAVSALAHFWEHGEVLRRWHNLKTQIGNEGEKANESGGTLNPALLNIG